MYEMPVYIRKYWIKRHNEANGQGKHNDGKPKTVDGAALNTYAEIEQSNLKRQ